MAKRLAAGKADDQHAEKNQKAGGSVRPEEAERSIAVLRVCPKRLVCKMKRGGKQRSESQPVRPHRPDRSSPKEHCNGVEGRDALRRLVAQAPRAGLHPDQSVVLDVLDCVESVI